MKLSFEYGGYKVSYNLAYKKTNIISIHVEKDGQVNVIAPLGTKVFSVMDKVKGNAPWILNELQKLGKLKRNKELREQYSYLGKNYGIEIVDDKELEKATVKLVRGKFVIQTPNHNVNEIREALVLWYKDKLEAKVDERLKVYEKEFTLWPKEVKVEDLQDALLRISHNRVLLDVTVAMLPVSAIDYILVKALCHFNYIDDEKQGEAKLAAVLTDYKASEQWIAENKNALSL